MSSNEYYSACDNVVKAKSFAFALRIVKLNRYLQEEKREFVLSKQLLRSGTAVGALVREAEQAESKADFTHKLAIALKEANETDYWIDLLHQSEIIDQKSFDSIKPNIVELIKLLTSIIKTTRQNMAKMRTKN
ncbi:four helix bundle protein [Chitinispirillales bacterium ANBcel5]|uniref:four helix bundle protein n=1 Tax=Cellulosispirillum alkaliphilum TaxID=3039283 RepID=UPI002A525670|nr:four helix bundle protein [Chitinispirillales bacterium ANBcel5]